jgi:hypothetical protein
MKFLYKGKNEKIGGRKETRSVRKEKFMHLMLVWRPFCLLFFRWIKEVLIELIELHLKDQNKIK